MQTISSVRELGSTLYNSPEERQEYFKWGLEKAAEKTGFAVSEKTIEKIVPLVTSAGLEAGLAEVKEVAAPYIKLYQEGEYKELASEGYSLVSEKVVQPVLASEVVAPRIEMVRETVAPKVEKAKEVAAPYIARGSELKESVKVTVAKAKEDERVQKAMVALKGKLSQVRERPADVVAELRETAVDLIKYEKLAEYREYMLSAEFAADTTKLVKEDLPQLVKEATRKGADAVSVSATAVQAELLNTRGIVVDAWKKGRETTPEVKSWDDLRGLAIVLVEETKSGLLSRAEDLELKEKLDDAVARLKIVFGLAEAEAAQEQATPVKPEVTTPATEAGEEDSERSSMFPDAKSLPPMPALEPAEADEPVTKE